MKNIIKITIIFAISISIFGCSNMLKTLRERMAVELKNNIKDAIPTNNSLVIMPTKNMQEDIKNTIDVPTKNEQNYQNIINIINNTGEINININNPEVIRLYNNEQKNVQNNDVLFKLGIYDEWVAKKDGKIAISGCIENDCGYNLYFDFCGVNLYYVIYDSNFIVLDTIKAFETYLQFNQYYENRYYKESKKVNNVKYYKRYWKYDVENSKANGNSDYRGICPDSKKYIVMSDGYVQYVDVKFKNIKQ